MIPIRNFGIVSRMARLALRHGGPDGERMVLELAQQLRNQALLETASAKTREASQAQCLELVGILERHRKARAPDDGGPTPETKAKRRRDALGALHKAGTISRQQMDAAEHIVAGYRLLIDGLGKAGTMRYEPPTDHAPRDEWSSGQIACYRRYIGWWKACAEHALPMEAIMTVLTEPAGVRDAERRHGMATGSLTAKLCEALSVYCGIVGWATGEAA